VCQKRENDEEIFSSFSILFRHQARIIQRCVVISPLDRDSYLLLITTSKRVSAERSHTINHHLIMNGASAAPRGRGAGINKPAWLVQQEREATIGNNNNAPHAASSGGGEISTDKVVDITATTTEEERDQFGRAVSGGGGGGGSRNNNNDDRIRGGSHDRRYNNDRSSRGGRRDRHYRTAGGGAAGRSDRGGGGGGGGGNNRSGIYFHSYEEERAWLDERRRKRRSRKSLFDVEPSPEQLAEEEARAALERDHLMMTGGMGIGGIIAAAAASAGMRTESTRVGLQPQQTRHARRLYIGNIPDIHESDVHNFFRDAIRSAIINPNPSHQKQYIENDPIISVYINRERRCKLYNMSVFFSLIVSCFAIKLLTFSPFSFPSILSSFTLRSRVFGVQNDGNYHRLPRSRWNKRPGTW